jgi:TatA/E family protein of Tat protein translocase
MGPLGWQETVFIFVLALLIFGPKKLPELGKTIGKALTEFRRASSELKATFDREMSSIERETESLKEVTSSYHNEISNESSSTNYDYNYDSSYYDGENQYSASSDSTATETSTVGASATQGAESTSGQAPEGTVATSLTDGTAGGSEEELAASESDLRPDAGVAPADGTAAVESKA